MRIRIWFTLLAILVSTPLARAVGTEKQFITHLEDQDTCTFYRSTETVLCWHNVKKRNISYSAVNPGGMNWREWIIDYMKAYSFRLVRNSPADALVFKRVFETEE